jgi:peptidoglycan/LPS O-acetylase OafA/YrhL
VSLEGLLSRTARPVAMIVLGLLAAAVALGVLEEPTRGQERYPMLFWSATAGATVLLLLTVVLTGHAHRRFRVAGLGGSAVLLSVLHGNDLSTGLARGLLLAGLLLAVATAIPALVQQLESSHERPVSRL